MRTTDDRMAAADALLARLVQAAAAGDLSARDVEQLVVRGQDVPSGFLDLSDRAWATPDSSRCPCDEGAWLEIDPNDGTVWTGWTTEDDVSGQAASEVLPADDLRVLLYAVQPLLGEVVSTRTSMVWGGS